jgi:CRP-like cAMP-binding protein
MTLVPKNEMNFAPKNEILARLEPAVALRMAGRFEQVTLARGSVLQDTGTPVEWVWFPEDTLICLAAESVEGESVSGGMVGRNGTFGAFEACGSRLAYARAIVQIRGEAWRIRAAHYRELFEASAALREAIHKHVEALLVEARQLVACTAIHRVDARMCRVLLDASARSHRGASLTLTQEELAHILGVQRSTIAVASSALQRAGVITSRRGAIEIVDFARLEAAACSCRETIAFAQQEIAGTSDHVCEA